MAKGSKKGACSANVQSAKLNCLRHDRREGKIPSYVNPHLTKDNRIVFEDEMIKGRKSIKPLVERAKLLYTEKTGQKWQDKTAPFREDVLKLKAGVTDEQLMEFKDTVERETGWKVIGIYLHNDEGYAHSKYIEGDEDYEINYHAHVLYSCQDQEKGTILRLPRKYFSLRQDWLAAATGMERGNPARETGIKHRNSMQQRIIAQEQRIEQLEEEGNKREKRYREQLEEYKAKLKAIEKENADNLATMKADYEKQIQKLEKRLERYDKRKEQEKEQHHTASWFGSKNQKIIDKLEEENSSLRKEVMDIRMHSYGEDARKISTFWKEQCRQLDPVLTADKEQQLEEAQKKAEKNRRHIEIPPVSSRPAVQKKPEVKQLNSEEYMKNKIEQKWEEVLDFATQHAKNQGMHRGILWLKDAFNEYLEMSDEVPGYGMGGQPGSQFNREVLAGKIALELGNGIGGRHVLDDEQLSRLKTSLDSIVNGQVQQQQFHR